MEQSNDMQHPYYDDHRLIGIDELSLMLDRSTNTLRVDSTRRPETLPPRVKLPGSRRILFKIGDVRKWIDDHCTPDITKEEGHGEI